jgi:hypothetical protein
MLLSRRCFLILLVLRSGWLQQGHLFLHLHGSDAHLVEEKKKPQPGMSRHLQQLGGVTATGPKEIAKLQSQ